VACLEVLSRHLLGGTTADVAAETRTGHLRNRNETVLLRKHDGRFLRSAWYTSFFTLQLLDQYITSSINTAPFNIHNEHTTAEM
jgi:hypothetical protein